MKNLKTAIANDYLIEKILYAGSDKCRVDVKSRFPKANGKNFFSYWLCSKYVARNYPKAFERANY